MKATKKNSESEIMGLAEMAKGLGIKKYDKLATLLTALGKLDHAIKVSELMGMKATKQATKEIELVFGDYEGNKTLSIGTRNEAGKFYSYLTIGKSKAKLIAEHIEAIKAFAE